MTKIIKAKVYFKRTSGRTSYRDPNFDGYPACWKDITPLEALHTNERGTQEASDAKGTYQIWLLKVSDADYDTCMYDPQCSLVSKPDAEAIAADLDPDFDEPEEITNEAVMQRLMIKALRGKAITKAEDDMLDPDKPAKGIGRKKSFLKRHALAW